MKESKVTVSHPINLQEAGADAILSGDYELAIAYTIKDEGTENHILQDFYHGGIDKAMELLLSKLGVNTDSTEIDREKLKSALVQRIQLAQATRTAVGKITRSR